MLGRSRARLRSLSPERSERSKPRWESMDGDDACVAAGVKNQHFENQT